MQSLVPAHLWRAPRGLTCRIAGEYENINNVISHELPSIRRIQMRQWQYGICKSLQEQPFEPIASEVEKSPKWTGQTGFNETRL
jgi:hypothetical protein